MQEPELEEEALRAEPQGETLVIERRSLETLPDEITVLSPIGPAAADAARAGLPTASARQVSRPRKRVSTGSATTI